MKALRSKAFVGGRWCLLGGCRWCGVLVAVFLLVCDGWVVVIFIGEYWVVLSFYFGRIGW